MKKIDLKKNLEERVQYTEWTAKNTWNVLDRISSAKKAPRGLWVRRLAPVLALSLVLVYLGVTGLTGQPGGPDTIREQYTARPMVTALAAGQGEGIGDLEAEPADSELSVSEKLQRDYPDLAPWLQPIGMSCEKDGIRLTLISGALKGNESLIVYSLQDMEGKYAGKELSPVLNLPETKTSDNELLDIYPKEHRYIYYSYTDHNQPVKSEDRTMSMRVNGYLVQRRVRLDLVKLLEKYGSEDLPLKKIHGAGSDVLDTAGFKEVPVLEDIALAGIGWAGDRLHVQFHALNSRTIEGKNYEPDASWFSSLEYDDQYWKIENLHSYSGWTETGSSNISWMEHKLNCTQEFLEQMRPVVNIYSTDELVEGDWEINFPLSMICDEACIEEIRSAQGSAAEEEKNYLVPRPEIYTFNAWPVTEDGYADLQAFLRDRVENRQVYLVKGTVQEVLSEKPLRVKINAGEDGESLPVVLERPAGRVFDWQPGNNYDIYGEVIGEYDGMPLLLAGYCYTRTTEASQLPESGQEEDAGDPEEAIRNRAEAFFAAWQERDASGMTLRCVPSEWSDTTDETIRRILAEKKLVNWQIDGMERYPDSPVMTIRCRLNTKPAEGGESSVQEYRLIAKKAKNNIWYFEPDSLLADADNVIRASEIAKENIVLLGGQDDMEGQTEDLPDYLQCLNSFLSCWSREDTAGMLAECPPEWEEEYHLSDLLAGFGKEMGIPGLWRIGQSYGTENDPMRAADCEVWLRNTPDDQDGWYHIDAQMQKGEDGKWYFIPFIASEYRPVRVKENNTAGQTVRNDLLPDGFTMEKLKAFFPEVTDSLRPLNLNCEKNGIRMELLYGGVTGDRSYLIYSLQDLEGIHPDREIEAEMKSTIGETEGDSSTILLNWDEAEHKGIYLFAQVYTNPVEHEDRTVTAKIGHIWFRKTEETDLNPILMKYGKEEEGIEAEGEIFRAARESGVKVLDNSNPLNIPLGKSDILLTGIGWIDGKLHVRVQNKGRENRVWGPDLYISNVEITATPLNDDGSDPANRYDYGSAALPIEWYDNDAGKVYQREDILNCAPEDMARVQLTALVSIQESALSDDWSVEFPLSMICAEEK